MHNGGATSGHYSLFQAITSGTTGTSNPNFDRTVTPDRANTHWNVNQPAYRGGTVAAGTAIYPLSNNAAGNLFYADTGGETSGAEPNWEGSCTAVVSMCVDGSVSWRNIGHSATIVDGTVTWVKVGSTQAETTQEIAGVENGDDSIAQGLSYDGIQDTGLWELLYKKSTNTIYQYNTYTTVETDYQCTDGSGSSCAGGTWVPTVVGLGSTNLSITLHNSGLSQDGNTLITFCGAVSVHR